MRHAKQKRGEMMEEDGVFVDDDDEVVFCEPKVEVEKETHRLLFVPQ